MGAVLISSIFFLTQLQKGCFSSLIGSLREDNSDRHGNDEARKQRSDWLNDEKESCCACGTHLVKFFDVVCQNQRENSKFKVLTTTRTYNSKSFILYLYFKGAFTSPFAACSVNNRGCEEEAIITKQLPFPKCLFSSDVFVSINVVAA